MLYFTKLKKTTAQLFLVAVYLILNDQCEIAAQIMTKAVDTIADKIVIYENQPLRLECNADVVGLNTSFSLITKNEIRRYFTLTPELILIYEPDSPLQSARKVFKVPEGRKWTVNYTEVVWNEENTRRRSVVVLFNKSRCSDAAVYECVVSYYNDKSHLTEAKGQQRLLSRAAVTEPEISVSPYKSIYSENDKVDLTCKVQGPPYDVTLTWQNETGAAYFGIETKVSNLTDVDCVKRKYEARLSLQFNNVSDNDQTFRCVVFDFVQQRKQVTNVTLKVYLGAKAGVVRDGDDDGLSSDWSIGIVLLVAIMAILAVLVAIDYIHCRKRDRQYRLIDNDVSQSKAIGPTMVSI